MTGARLAIGEMAAIDARAAEVEALLERAVARFRRPAPSWRGPLACGVDLGTATCVIVVLDRDGEPVYLDAAPSGAIRDGVVVDLVAAVGAVARLRDGAEGALGCRIEEAVTAHPPGVGPGESRACRFVLERAGMGCRRLVDEVSAANRVLGIVDGVVADVGGGSTGVGVYVGGELAGIGDRPGGGHHLDLILAGALGIPLEEAEREKREGGARHLAALRPGLERIGTSVELLTRDHPALPVHLVGGAVMIPGAAAIVASHLGRPVVGYRHSLYITPLGIGRCWD